MQNVDQLHACVLSECDWTSGHRNYGMDIQQQLL